MGLGRKGSFSRGKVVLLKRVFFRAASFLLKKKGKKGSLGSLLEGDSFIKEDRLRKKQASV